MLKASVFSLVLLAFTSFSAELPKKILGTYDADIPAFEFEYQNKTLKASGFHVSLVLKSEIMIYKCGSLEFDGIYEEVLEEGDNVNIGVSIMNTENVKFDLDLCYNKKNRSVSMCSLVGIPAPNMQKREIVLKSQGSRFGRL
jgi:hypothetical protein